MSEVKKPLVVFLSAPFTGVADEDLIDNYKNNTSELIEIVCEYYGVKAADVEILCTSTMDGQLFLTDESNYRHKDLYCVGKCISELMSSSDVVVFGHNWRLSIGCMIEQYTAAIYGLDYIDLDHTNPYVHTTHYQKRKGLRGHEKRCAD